MALGEGLAQGGLIILLIMAVVIYLLFKWNKNVGFIIGGIILVYVLSRINL